MRWIQKWRKLADATRRIRAWHSRCIFLFLLVLLVSVCGLATDWAVGWSREHDLGGVSSRSRDPAMLIDADGALHLLTIVDQQTGPPLLLDQVSMNGRTFSTGFQLVPAWESPRRLHAASDAEGRIHLVWIDRAQGLSGVLYSVVYPDTKTIGAPMLVSSPATRVASPQVSLDKAGGAIITWAEGSGPEDQICFVTIRNGEIVGGVVPLGEPTRGMRLLQTVRSGALLWVATLAGDWHPDRRS